MTCQNVCDRFTVPKGGSRKVDPKQMTDVSLGWPLRDLKVTFE